LKGDGLLQSPAAPGT